MKNETVLNNFYNIMRKYNFVYLTLSYIKYDGNRLYNENLKKWITLTDLEIQTLNNLKHLSVEQFNDFYFKKIKETKVSNKKLVD